MKPATSSVFENQYKKLNPEQKKAVDTVDGPMIVIAGPGTGKTSILTLRIANILRKTDTAPENILALTFTESGVHSMRRKLVDIIGAAGYRIPIHTFHSFCNEVIKNFPQEFPRIIGAQHVTDLDQINILENVITETKLTALKPYGNPLYYLKSVLSFIKELKREDISAKEYLKYIKTFEKDLDGLDDVRHAKGAYKGEIKAKYKPAFRKIENSKEFVLLYEKYEEALEEQRLYDFEDMIIEVLRALRENKNLLLELQETYQYILADEHQDANRGQNKLLELLSGFHENPNLFVVGDEKQAIFRFQGATLENFLYFKKRFPGAEVVTLVKNYRSTQGILDVSHELISKNPASEIVRPRLEASDLQATSNMFVWECETPEQEAAFIAEHIQAKIKKGEPAEHIAVLFRDNKSSAEISRVFDAFGLPHVIHTDIDVFADEYVQKLFFVLRAVNDFGNEYLLSPVLFVDIFKLNHLDVYKVLQRRKQSHRSLIDIIRSKSELESAGVDEPERFIELYTLLHRLSGIAKNKGLVESFQEIANQIGYVGTILSKPRSLELIAAYDALIAHITELVERHKYAKLSDYISLVDKMVIHNVSIRAKSVTSYPGKINLMTTHKSKGLEYDSVYVTHLNEGHWGGRRNNTYFLPIGAQDAESLESDMADERRLLYVAVTRAKKEVHLTYANRRLNGKELLPSRFLEEMSSNLVQSEKVHTNPSKILTEIAKPKPKQGLDIKNREYLSRLFLESGFSVSALNNYLTCPWRFFFLNLIRVPQVEERHQLYGTSIHETLRTFFDEYKNDRPMTKKDFLEFFEKALNRKALSDSDYELFLKRGRESLGGYYDTYKGTWSKDIFNEFNIADVHIPVEVDGKAEQILLRGQLDKIELNGDLANVVDYKTGNPKSRREIEGETASSEGNYKRQLVFYKILIDRSPKSKFTMRTGEIDFVEPNKQGNYKKEKFEVTDADVAELIPVIEQCAKEIITLSFWDTDCKDPECGFCEMKKLMESGEQVKPKKK